MVSPLGRVFCAVRQRLFSFCTSTCTFWRFEWRKLELAQPRALALDLGCIGNAKDEQQADRPERQHPKIAVCHHYPISLILLKPKRVSAPASALQHPHWLFFDANDLNYPIYPLKDFLAQHR